MRRRLGDAIERIDCPAREDSYALVSMRRRLGRRVRDAAPQAWRRHVQYHPGARGCCARLRSRTVGPCTEGHTREAHPRGCHHRRPHLRACLPRRDCETIVSIPCPEYTPVCGDDTPGGAPRRAFYKAVSQTSTLKTTGPPPKRPSPFSRVCIG